MVDRYLQDEFVKFTQALKIAYSEFPCQVLPNALWKTLARINDFQTRFRVTEGNVEFLEARRQGSLLVYWQRRPLPESYCQIDIADLKFAIIHQELLPVIEAGQFSSRKRYFRLVHARGEKRPVFQLPKGYSFRLVDLLTEVEQVAILIGRCYAEITLTPGSVLGWLKHPVFAPDLWLWVIDKESGNPVGLGIAELDQHCAEGSLEWIQVLPGYRGRGIGKALVSALLDRLDQQAEFTTVSGQVDNPTRPQDLYRRCGFRGNDVWWVLGE